MILASLVEPGEFASVVRDRACRPPPPQAPEETVAGSLGYNRLEEFGPTITITFRDASRVRPDQGSAAPPPGSPRRG